MPDPLVFQDKVSTIRRICEHEGKVALILYMLVVAYFGVTIYAANQVQTGVWQSSVIKSLWYIAIATMFLLAVFPLQIALVGSEIGSAEAEMPQISLGAALGALGFSVAAGGLSAGTVHSQAVRRSIARVVGQRGSFNPDSVVHLTGVVLSCFLLSGILVLFVLSGGLAGLAESIETSGVNAVDTIFTTVLEVLAAALSVGYAIRRTGQQTLQRLGLVPLRARDIGIGIAFGAALTLAAFVYTLIWEQLSPPDQFQEQTQAIEQLTLALSTLPMAFLISIAAALGEEIFVRGALQPIFGVWLSSLFFALLHTQYLITPTLLLIFAISVAFGLLRQRYNTTTAMIAHFVYNFIPLFLIVLGTMLGGTAAS